MPRAKQLNTLNINNLKIELTKKKCKVLYRTLHFTLYTSAP